MPIPTDTFWNIKRLNWIFAGSAVVLFGVIGLAIMQDFEKEWKKPQKSGRVWDAALVSEKIKRIETAPEHQKALDDLAKREAGLQVADDKIKSLQSEIKKIVSDQSTLEFSLNSLKANVTVNESRLQDAIAAGDKTLAADWLKKLEQPRKDVAAESEKLATFKSELSKKRTELATETANRDQLEKDRKALVGDIAMLGKKKESLQPTTPLGLLSQNVLRSMPLFPFPTGVDRIQQVVLPEIQTEMPPLRVATVDRCMTCHVNIANKDFSETKVLGYLEEQSAVARNLVLPLNATGKSGDPLATQAAPGSLALAEFWHDWAWELAPQILKKPGSVNRIKAIANTIGKDKPLAVTFDGKDVDAFAFDAVATKPEDIERQNLIVTQAIDAWLRYDATTVASDKDLSTNKRVTVKFTAKADKKAGDAARKAAMLYIEDVRLSMPVQLKPDAFKMLLNRYRFTLVDVVNVARKQQGLTALDPSPVLLAHPQIMDQRTGNPRPDIWVDADGKHNFEIIGCTSCHDGSGQETNFILAAHTPREILVDEKSGEPVFAQQIRTKGGETKKTEPPTLSSMLKTIASEENPIPQNVTSLKTELAAVSVESNEIEHGQHGGHAMAYVDPSSGKIGKAVTQEAYWVAKYEAEAGRSMELVHHEWDWPMRTPKYIQSNCLRCHTDVYDIKDTAPVVYEGRKLFTQMGCVNCHQMDSIPADQNRKVGTDLRHVASKLSPAFINSWVWSPKAFRPTTKMPQFFMLENNSSDEELRRTQQEARAMTEYLVRSAEPLAVKNAIPSDGKGNADAGRTAFNSLGCLACHTNLDDTSGDKRKDGKAISIGEKWIVTDLVKSGDLAKEIREKNGKDATAEELSKEALKLYDEMTYNQRQMYVKEHLEAPDNGLPANTKYTDGTAKPIFVHHGPELSGIGTKLTAGWPDDTHARQWLYDWVKDPRHYSSYTVMPRLRLSDQQALDLVEYLVNQKRTNDSPEDSWKANLAPVDAPKLREMTSLMLRARFSADTAFAKAVEDKELTALATDALTTPINDKTAAAEQVKSLSLEEKQLVFLGKKLIAHYGCMSCHAINGTETISSPCANLSDWGQKQVSKLDYGYVDPHKVHELPELSKVQVVNGLSPDAVGLLHDNLAGKTNSSTVDVAWPHVEHLRTSWLTQKLNNTRIWDRGKALLEPNPKNNDFGKPYDKLKMPTFYFTDEQVDAIVNFVISNREKLVSQKMVNLATNQQAKQIARGRELADRYNCVGCHVIEGNLPAVQQYFKSDEITTKAPPSLRGEGNKIQHAWLFNFLKNVEPLRPLPVIRMPSFPLTDEDATSIASYFAAASNRESQELARVLDPVQKYVTSAKAAAAKSGATTGQMGMPVGDDWFLQPGLATQATYLKTWSMDRRQMTEVQMDPTKNSAQDMGKSYATILFKSEFTQQLYNAPYPFVDSPRPEISDERFHKGEAFFYEMQCLKCHVLGDPNVAGANKSPTAPNLGLAYRRLQRRWVRNWVQEPPIIQVGTAMPPFFTGLPVFDLQGQPWPKSQGAPPELCEDVEKDYGHTVTDQTDLLLDFLYAAGVRGYTGVQPAAMKERKVTPAPAPAPKPEAKPAPKVEEAPKPVEEKKIEAKPTATGTIKGKISLGAKPPPVNQINMAAVAECANFHPNPVDEETIVANDKNELKWAFVSISDPPPGNYTAPETPAEIDQVGCMYSPHVVGMMVGQKLLIKNGDAFLHNVHGLPSKNPDFNKGQTTKGQTDVVLVAKVAEEPFRVKCDVHPWMTSYVGVFDHPFFAISGDDGSFTIKDVPAGSYTIKVHHETLGDLEVPVTVETGKTAEITGTYKP